MSKLIKLTNSIVNRMEVEVCCNTIGALVISRVLNRTELVYIISSWNNNHTSWVLTSSSSYTCTTDCKTHFFRSVHNNTVFFCIFFNKAESSFFRNSRNSTRFKDILLAEKFFRISVRFILIFAREIKVYIRCFISLKSKECFKWNIVSVLFIKCTTLRAVFRWQVKA